MAPGQVTISITYSDGSFSIACATTNTCAALTVGDATPPVISSVTPSKGMLWPPNHKMVNVTLAVSATDNPGPPACSITGVSSNEPVNGGGDGNTAPDWSIVGPLSVDLRAEHVTLLGKVSDDRLASVLAGATVLAAPSLAEGFGLPVLEAMAAGVPVVHSDDPALVEVAGGAGTVVRRGDLASLTEGLRAVLADPDHTIEAGLTRASEFTWEKTARGVWDTHA